MRYAVGLTGGIGSGKSTVARKLAALGAGVVDTDELAHGLTGSDGAAMPAIREAFGAGFISPGRALDRAAMRRAVFADPLARGRLEAILHPLIREAAERGIEGAPGPYVVLVVPLLFEARNFRARVARTLCVDCPEPLQVERACARSAMDPAEVRAIMAAQWPRWRRLQAADEVVWNGGEPGALDPQLERLHRAFRAAAAP